MPFRRWVSASLTTMTNFAVFTVLLLSAPGPAADSFQCGRFHATWAAGATGGVWSIYEGDALLLAGGSGSGLGADVEPAEGPFSADCRQVVLFDPKREELIITELLAPPRPVKTVSLKAVFGKGRPCTLAQLHFVGPHQLALVMGCHGWHGAGPFRLDFAGAPLWYVDSPQRCRLEASSRLLQAMPRATPCRSSPFGERRDRKRPVRAGRSASAAKRRRHQSPVTGHRTRTASPPSP